MRALDSKIARTMSGIDLARSADAEPLNELELLDKNAGRKFLDYYGKEGLQTALTRYGLFAALERRGYTSCEISTRAVDDAHALVVSGIARGETERVSLVELVVRRDRMVPQSSIGTSGLAPAYDVLVIDWLMLMHPKSAFTAEKPRLPGQGCPGLGLGWRILSLLERTRDRLEFAALAVTAQHLHSAEHYARELPFFEPRADGQLRALLEELRVRQNLTVAQASWAVEWGHVRINGTPLHWRGDTQMGTEETSLTHHLHSDAYRVASEEAKRADRVEFHRDAFDAQWETQYPSLLCHAPDD